MKNLFTLLLLLTGLNAFVQAQSVFHLSPVPASATGTGDDTDIATDAEITNLTGAVIHLKWERNVISLTPGCETAVCDPVLCWARFVNAKSFEMAPNEVGQMLVHFYPNGAMCEGIVHVKVTNIDNPVDTVVGVYLLNQTSGTKDLPAANVKLFPNPVQDFFSLEHAENVAIIRIFSLDGREVALFDANSTNFYSIQNQPAGNYVIALVDKNGQTFQAMELKKN